jgi:hypothetical protein
LARSLQFRKVPALTRPEKAMSATHLRVTLAVVAVVTLMSAPAEAQRRDAWGATAQSEGYRDGARAGGDDARDGRPFEYQRHRDYRDGDRGYQSRSGRRDDYARQYRAGFIAGYRDGYNSGGGRGPTGGYSRPASRSRTASRRAIARASTMAATATAAT